MARSTQFALVLSVTLLMITRSLAFSKCSREIDLGFVIDCSASMGETNFNHIKKFVRNVVKRFVVSPDVTRVGVIPFSHYFKIGIRFNQFDNFDELAKGIDTLAYEGAGSSLSSALKIAQLELFNIENGARTKVPSEVDTTEVDEVLQAVVVVTDGGTSTGIDSLLLSAEALKDTGKRVFVVGLGEHENVKNLKMISSEPVKSHFFGVKTGAELPKLISKLSKAICKDNKPKMKEFTVTENKKVLTSLQYQEE